MITNRLDKKEVLDLIDKNKINKFFLDIDYTVFDFETGNNNGIKKLNNNFSGLGDEVGRIFDLILRAKRNLNQLTKKELNEYKNIKIEKYWSRENMIVLAANKLGLELKAREIVKLRKIYWKAVSDAWIFYKDAIPFLNKIKKEKIKMIWVTGSDSVLKVKQNKNEIELIYDPIYSWKEKSKRLKKLLRKYPGKLVIGDPIDKPNLWEKLLKGIEIKKTLVVGDSYETDLKKAEELGIKTILIKR